ncbi:MAG: hypothetical protein R2856_36615 [Caldilineaceae bacterium]
MLHLLKPFHLIATGTTGERVQNATSMAVERMLSGPYGGDAQIAARVAEGLVAGVIFLVDPLYALPTNPISTVCCVFAMCTMCRWPPTKPRRI